jgi:hypothetical protein
MAAHARLSIFDSQLSETEIFAKIQIELVQRYSVAENLASEMAWDLMEILTAVDGDMDRLEKYFLHQ